MTDLTLLFFCLLQQSKIDSRVVTLVDKESPTVQKAMRWLAIMLAMSIFIGLAANIFYKKNKRKKVQPVPGKSNGIVYIRTFILYFNSLRCFAIKCCLRESREKQNSLVNISNCCDLVLLFQKEKMHLSFYDWHLTKATELISVAFNLTQPLYLTGDNRGPFAWV